MTRWAVLCCALLVACSSPSPSDSTASIKGSWTERLAGSPPLDIPEASPAIEREELSQLAREVRALQDELEPLWNSTPSCTEPSKCGDSWREIAIALGKLDRGLDSSRLTNCGEGQGVAYVSRRNSHQAFIASIIVELDRRFERAAIAGHATPDYWSSLRKATVAPPARLRCPRLKKIALLFGPPMSILFSPGASELTAEAQPALARVASAMRENNEIYEARGHADPTEDDADSLAKTRAERVVAYLVDEGIVADRLRIVSYGSALPIRLGREGNEASRRVDFEISRR